AGPIDPAAALHRALDAGPSGAAVTFDPPTDLAITPHLTFRSADGAYCREFSAETASGRARAIACRADARWSVLAAAQESVALAGQGGYAPASAAAAPAIDAVIDALMAEPPLSADEERALITGSWRE
ncbi:MAG: hypothetical protein MI723_12270, partial [Caulobacterales bacterium]|nr:hypothetical protein [Caulobacterales bacterium]